MTGNGVVDLEQYRRDIERAVLNDEVVEQQGRRDRYRSVAREFHEPTAPAVIEVWGDNPDSPEYRVDLAELARIRPGTPEFCAKYIPPPDPEMRIVDSGRGGLIVENEAGERFRANASGLVKTRRSR